MHQRRRPRRPRCLSCLATILAFPLRVSSSSRRVPRALLTRFDELSAALGRLGVSDLETRGELRGDVMRLIEQVPVPARTCSLSLTIEQAVELPASKLTLPVPEPPEVLIV